FGSPQAAGGCARIAPRATPRGTAFLSKLIRTSLPAHGRIAAACVVRFMQRRASDVNGFLMVAGPFVREGPSGGPESASKMPASPGRRTPSVAPVTHAVAVAAALFASDA